MPEALKKPFVDQFKVTTSNSLRAGTAYAIVLRIFAYFYFNRR